ncbi:DNA-directed RNA polymerase I subunit RPA2-like [Uloborus diversus]|uniref:DNA-directed RNA polymerase I subunit RPA2-like n=1 Tax=Uloborus diversus TaxID=327109 RepID=UPI0024091489|nr:DNA-directed RNA polymerase I subunit RPA2-like [Uloborus diversus]
MDPYTDLKKTQIEIVESKPDKPSLRSVQTESYGNPKKAQYKAIQDFSRAHVQSFNYMLDEGLNHMIQNIPPLEIGLANGDQIKVQFRRCWIDPPAIKRGTVAKTNRVYPSECRGRHVSYKGGFQVSLSWTLNGVVQEIIEKPVGEIPIMVKSRACNLNNLTPSQLVAVGEEESEFGGYFVINGLEKVVRLLIMQRRNYMSFGFTWM